MRNSRETVCSPKAITKAYFLTKFPILVRNGGKSARGSYVAVILMVLLNGAYTFVRLASAIISFVRAFSSLDLKDIMRTAGEVTFADAHKQTPNEGIVCFLTREDLERALDRLQGKEVNGRKLRLIDDSERKESRSRSRSRRSRSRSRSRRSSRSRSSRSRERSRSRSESIKKDELEELHSARSRSCSRSASARSRTRSASREVSPKIENNTNDVTEMDGINDNKSRSPTPKN